jgi:hypothetical protein
MATMMIAALAETAELPTTSALSEAITIRRGDFVTSGNTLLEQVSRDIFRHHPHQPTFLSKDQLVRPSPPAVILVSSMGSKVLRTLLGTFLRPSARSSTAQK